MTRTYQRIDRGIPWWAALGAPLFGVPAVVAVLALVSPGAGEHVEEPEPEYTVEQVQIESSDAQVPAKRSI